MSTERHNRVADLLEADGRPDLARIWRATDDQRIQALAYLSGYSPEAFEAVTKRVWPRAVRKERA